MSTNDTQSDAVQSSEASSGASVTAGQGSPEVSSADDLVAQYQEKISAAAALIQSYSGYPGVSQAFATMVTANAGDPQRLMDIVQQMVDTIEQVKANPHASYPVHPAIAGVVDAVRQVELEKPDPLNLLRGDQGQATDGKGNFVADAMGTIGSLMMGGAAAAGAGSLVAQAEGPEVGDKLPWADLGDTGKYLKYIQDIGGFTSDVRDMRTPGINGPMVG